MLPSLNPVFGYKCKAWWSQSPKSHNVNQCDALSYEVSMCILTKGETARGKKSHLYKLSNLLIGFHGIFFDLIYIFQDTV